MVTSHKAILESINPSTKEVLGRVPIMSKVQVDEIVAASHKAYEIWQLTSYKQRAKYVLKLRQVIAARADELAQLISEEVGKPLAEAYLSELTGPLDTCVWMVENAEKLLADANRRLLRAVQGVSVKRFDPFQGAGGQQSFASAFLDEKGNGTVLSGIHARDGVRVYAKEVRNFQSERELSEEEKGAIDEARSKL